MRLTSSQIFEQHHRARPSKHQTHRQTDDGIWVIQHSKKNTARNRSNEYDSQRARNSAAISAKSASPKPKSMPGLSLGFTKDGTQILTLTSDGTLRVWDLDKGLEIALRLDDLLR
jgi:WD40 repeat protein